MMLPALPFFWYCADCAVLWQGAHQSTCWLCQRVGTQCQDDFVYTAASMNCTSEL